MTFRRQSPCLLILIALAAMTGRQSASFAQTAYPGNNPATTQPTASGTYIPQYQPPTAGVATGGYPDAVPGAGMPTTGVPATGIPTTGGGMPAGTTAGATPPGNYMIDRPLGAVQNGPQPGNQAPVQNGRPIVPPPEGYQPTQEEMALIGRFLAAWHDQSKNIEALDYDFTCREYSAYGVSETYGRVKFRAPNQGLIEIDRELVNGKQTTETNKKMKVICTGEAVYQFDFGDKKLTEFVIPAEDRGKGVMDSPLMILVGANPREMQDRFYLKVLPSPDSLANCICLQAWPKWVEDTKEFKYVNVAIDAKTFHATILEVYNASGEGSKAYRITNTNKKSLLDRIQVPWASKDEFGRNVILNSKPRDWAFETKKDFIPESSGQQIARQPNTAVGATPAPMNPQYANPVNTPTNNNTAVPGAGMPGYPTGQPAAQQQPGVMPQGQAGYQGVPQYSVPQNNTVPQYQGNPYTAPPQNQYMAMPPQGNTVSPSVLR